jgi:hypothetical protein
MATGPLDLSLPSTRQRWFAAGLLLFFIVLSLQYSWKITGKEDRNGTLVGSAILRWQNQLREISAGDNPYDGSPYPNPPIMALLLIPFTQLPPLAGALCWFYLKVGLTLLAILWTFRLVEALERPFPEWAKALTVLLSLRPVMGDLTHGNVNLFILFLIVAALYAYRQGKDFLSGMTLALAIACKVTPALFIPYFLWKRAWIMLAGCGVGLVLFFGPVPGLYYGQWHNIKLLKIWSDHMVKPYVVQGVVFYSEHNNQSLPGLVLRLATHSPSFSTYENDVYKPLHYHNLLALDPGTARWIVKGCMALFAGLIVLVCRTPMAPRYGWRLAAEFGLVLLGMLLFSERTWKHHCVTLLVPLAVLCYYLSAERPGKRMRAFLIGCLAMVVLLMTSTSTFKLLPRWDETAKLAQVYGAYVWAYAVLVLALVVLLVRREPAGDAAPAQSA